MSVRLAGMETILVDRASATIPQLLRAVLDRLDHIDIRLEHMENRMTALTDSVDALKGAVDGVAQRLLPKVAALETALAAALSDDADAAAVLADATAATADIRLEVDRLNALGTDPETPVDPAAPDAGTVPDVIVVSESETPTP